LIPKLFGAYIVPALKPFFFGRASSHDLLAFLESSESLSSTVAAAGAG
jgi:hypothetical protein